MSWRSDLASYVARFVALLFFMLIAYLVISQLWGCGTPAATKVEHAAVTASYGVSLDACKAAAKDAGSFAVFEACEKEAALRLCAERPTLKPVWARCDGGP